MAENGFFQQGGCNLQHAHPAFCSIQFSHCCAMPAVPMHLVNCSFLKMVLFQCSASCQQELNLLPPAKNQCHHRCKQHLVSYLFNNPNIDCSVFNSVISSKQTSKSGLCRVILYVFHLCLFGPLDLNTLVTLPSINYC